MPTRIRRSWKRDSLIRPRWAARPLHERPRREGQLGPFVANLASKWHRHPEAVVRLALAGGASFTAFRHQRPMRANLARTLVTGEVKCFDSTIASAWFPSLPTLRLLLGESRLSPSVAKGCRLKEIRLMGRAGRRHSREQHRESLEIHDRSRVYEAAASHVGAPHVKYRTAGTAPTRGDDLRDCRKTLGRRQAQSTTWEGTVPHSRLFLSSPKGMRVELDDCYSRCPCPTMSPDLGRLKIGRK